MNEDQLERDRLALVAAARANQPSLVRRLPDSFRLNICVDTCQLRNELAASEVKDWAPQRTMADTAVVAVSNPKWTVRALRSPAGDVNRTDPGDAQSGMYQWTAHAERYPLMREFVERLPIDSRAVRLMSLSGGGTAPEHVDSCIGLSWGRVRLHVPLVTNEWAHMVFDHRRVHWASGVWYGSFSLPHSIENLSPEARIHLVIDGDIKPEFVQAIPRDVTDQIRPQEVVTAEPFAPAAASTAQPARPVVADVPAAYLSLAAPAGRFVSSTKLSRVRISQITASTMVLIDSQGRRLVLLRVDNGRYRIYGWPHKQIDIAETKFGLAVTLRERVGPADYARTIAARSA